MTGKRMGIIIQQLLLICGICIKNEYIPYLHFQRQLKSWKTNHSFNDSKRKRIALSCSKKKIDNVRN